MSEIIEVFEDLQKTFAEFRGEMEAKVSKRDEDDVVRSEKIDRINGDLTALGKELDALNKKLAAAQVGAGGGDQPDPAKREHAQAFNQFFRKGTEAGLRDLEVKAAMSTDSDPDGGYLVPEEMEATIDRVHGTISVMRQLATVRTISTDTYKKLINEGGAGSGWVGERDARAATATPTLRELVFNMRELYANPAVTQRTLDDARVDIGQWLADEVATEFAEQEGAGWFSGDGVNEPYGIHTYPTVANASHTWGKIGFVKTGVAAALSDGSNPGEDNLISLYYSLKPGYRNGAAFVMSDATMEPVRKFKDGDGNLIWNPPSAMGEVSTILGKPVYNDDNVQAVGANNFPILFGNFARGYLILDRFGIRVLRDPFTNKPYVHFYTTKRTTGGVQNFEAIKALKCAA